VRIAIADDHMIIRRGMQLIVAKRPGWTIAAEPANADELFDVVRRDAVDVVVLDLKLRGHSGLEILTRLRHDFPRTPALVLSSAPEEQYALHCLRAGARGYVQKDATADEILGAIERVAAGRTWVSPAVAEQMAMEIVEPSRRPPHELLSPREFEVFRSIAAGRSMSEIALSLGISIKTASTYRTRILEKTNLQNNAEIVAYAIRTGIL
jgi:two-component system invasion response regulator UvrY